MSQHSKRASQLHEFAKGIATAQKSGEVWRLLDHLAQAAFGHVLFTVTTVEMDAGLARRVYTSHPVDYPVSGTKPIHRDSWFAIVHDQRKSFVANTIEDIARVFPDHALIASLGCASVLNLPIFLRDELVATVNMLAGAHHYTPERVTAAEDVLPVPASLCWALAHQLDRGQA